MSACLPSTHGTGDDHGFDGGLVVSVGAVPEEIIILLSPFSKLDTSIFDTFYMTTPHNSLTLNPYLNQPWRRWVASACGCLLDPTEDYSFSVKYCFKRTKINDI